MARLTVFLLALSWLVASPVLANPIDRWQPHIAEASARFAVPQDWIRHVILAESGGRIEIGGKPITSSAGAMGLMQLMPGTWRDMRAELGLGRDPHDPRDNILAGTAYLRQMHDRFGYPGLFAAYHAGPARYADHLSAGQPLPPETRAYVRQLLIASGKAPPFPAPGLETDKSWAASRRIGQAGDGPASSPIFVELKRRR